LENETTADVELAKDEKTITIHCKHHPSFKTEGLINDIALCVSDADFPTRFGYENIDIPAAHVREHTSLFLLGYGCRDVGDIGNPDKIGQLYGGIAPVHTMAAPPDDHIQTKGGLVICRGDSGGAAYVLGAQDEPNGPRSIIGLNSGYFPRQRVSAITPFGGDAATFIHTWAAEKKVFLCGVHSQAENCRDRFVPGG
jgi:hypothetical protein